MRRLGLASGVGLSPHSHPAFPQGDVLSGVFHLNTQAPNFVDALNMTDVPLARLKQEAVRPSREALAQVMEELR